MPKLATSITCTGCAACADACPHDALAMVTNDEGFPCPRLTPATCVECGVCERACPVLAEKKTAPRPGFPAPFAGWSTTPAYRQGGASGGVFAELAAGVLASGGVVVGARIQGLAVKHDLVFSLDDMPVFQGSKYLQSETAGVYRRVLEQLQKGRKVLFSGTPCQVAGMVNVAGHRAGRENLITCDLVCMGVPSRYLWERYVRARGDGVQEVGSFRDKQEGWKNGFAITLRNVDGGEVRSTYHAGDFFWRATVGHLALRNSCYDCPFASLTRVSDVTLADFWGLSRFQEEQAGGVSLVIAHSPFGMALLQSLKSLVLHPATWEEALPANPRVYEGTSNLPYRRFPSRRFLAFALRRLPYETLNKLYTGRIPRWQVWWWPYKAALRGLTAAVKRGRKALFWSISASLRLQKT